MKKLILSLSIIIAAVSLVACSKDKGGGNANINNNGVYAGTPNETRCANGAYPGMPYNQGYQGGYQQRYYGNQYGQYGNQYGNQYGQYGHQGNINCIPQNAMYGGGYPYYFQANYQIYLGTCDLRFSGRGQLCPNGYQCRPAYGTMGVCMRGF